MKVRMSCCELYCCTFREQLRHIGSTNETNRFTTSFTLVPLNAPTWCLTRASETSIVQISRKRKEAESSWLSAVASRERCPPGAITSSRLTANALHEDGYILVVIRCRRGYNCGASCFSCTVEGDGRRMYVEAINYMVRMQRQEGTKDGSMLGDNSKSVDLANAEDQAAGFSSLLACFFAATLVSGR